METDTTYMELTYTLMGKKLVARQYVIDNGESWALINISYNEKNNLEKIKEFFKPYSDKE